MKQKLYDFIGEENVIKLKSVDSNIRNVTIDNITMDELQEIRILLGQKVVDRILNLFV